MTTSTPPSPSSQRPRRRSSQLSGRNVALSPTHSRQISMSHRRTSSRSSLTPGSGEAALLSPVQVNGVFGSPMSAINGQDGMGSLEDELAAAWEEGEEDDEEEELEEDQDAPIPNGIKATASPVKSHPNRSSRPSSSHTVQSPISPTKSNVIPSPIMLKSRRRTRTDSTTSDTKHAVDDLPPELRLLIQDIEDLARQGTQLFLPASEAEYSTASDPTLPLPHTPPTTARSLRVTPDAAISSLITHLHNLAPQTTLETQASRLITAHTSLTTHLAHQTRSLQTAAYPLLSPLHPPPNPADADALLNLLNDSLTLLPQPSFTSLNSLTHLSTAGRDAVGSLSALSDSLHMTRQLEATAARRLKSARECATELRRELDQAERGRRWLDEQDWGARLRRRDVARECNQLVEGFGVAAGEWRARLVA